MPEPTKTTDLSPLLQEMAEAEARMRHSVPTVVDVICSLVEATASIGGAVGGLLYLSHLVFGWPS